MGERCQGTQNRVWTFVVVASVNRSTTVGCIEASSSDALLAIWRSLGAIDELKNPCSKLKTCRNGMAVIRLYRT